MKRKHIIPSLRGGTTKQSVSTKGLPRLWLAMTLTSFLAMTKWLVQPLLQVLPYGKDLGWASPRKSFVFYRCKAFISKAKSYDAVLQKCDAIIRSNDAIIRNNDEVLRNCVAVLQNNVPLRDKGGMQTFGKLSRLTTYDL